MHSDEPRAESLRLVDRRLHLVMLPPESALGLLDLRLHVGEPGLHLAEGVHGDTLGSSPRVKAIVAAAHARSAHAALRNAAEAGDGLGLDAVRALGVREGRERLLAA